ncbi:hypothetical protein [Corallococcus macrosporus]|uniref:Uncharacterized protein n=1 Tax=Myxococcus fulvus (strain ATCC BAA-855 / HW-1) TaxID=483219 RepID=F8CQS8_MYXFH|nr:hypothetical protein [Corallococcus macrosporus]AEI67992.1 hypothetical protein LILAB_30555 [Corallococcus macrosporus]
MPIVFDEVRGSVIGGPQPDAGQRPSGEPAPVPPPADPTAIARALRLITQRKARLIAD